MAIVDNKTINNKVVNSASELASRDKQKSPTYNAPWRESITNDLVYLPDKGGVSQIQKLPNLPDENGNFGRDIVPLSRTKLDFKSNLAIVAAGNRRRNPSQDEQPSNYRLDAQSEESYNPRSNLYNPYAHGSTYNGGVTSDKAKENSAKAKDEYALLKEVANYQMNENGMNADQFMAWLNGTIEGSKNTLFQDKFPTLFSMENYRKAGGALEMDEAVDFALPYFYDELKAKEQSKADKKDWRENFGGVQTFQIQFGNPSQAAGALVDYNSGKEPTDEIKQFVENYPEVFKKGNAYSEENTPDIVKKVPGLVYFREDNNYVPNNRLGDSIYKDILNPFSDMADSGAITPEYFASVQLGMKDMIDYASERNATVEELYNAGDAYIKAQVDSYKADVAEKQAQAGYNIEERNLEAGNAFAYLVAKRLNGEELSDYEDGIYTTIRNVDITEAREKDSDYINATSGLYDYVFNKVVADDRLDMSDSSQTTSADLTSRAIASYCQYYYDDILKLATYLNVSFKSAANYMGIDLDTLAQQAVDQSLNEFADSLDMFKSYTDLFGTGDESIITDNKTGEDFQNVSREAFDKRFDEMFGQEADKDMSPEERIARDIFYIEPEDYAEMEDKDITNMFKSEYGYSADEDITEDNYEEHGMSDDDYAAYELYRDYSNVGDMYTSASADQQQEMRYYGEADRDVIRYQYLVTLEDAAKRREEAYAQGTTPTDDIQFAEKRAIWAPGFAVVAGVPKGLMIHADGLLNIGLAAVTRDYPTVEHNYRMKYATPQECRAALQHSINSLDDNSLKTALQAQLDNYAGDIYKFRFDTNTAEIRNVIGNLEDKMSMYDDFVRQYITEADWKYYMGSASATNSMMYMLEAMLVMNAMGYAGGATSGVLSENAARILSLTVTMGAGEGAEVKLNAIESGESTASANTKGLLTAAATGLTEAMFDGVTSRFLRGNGIIHSNSRTFYKLEELGDILSGNGHTRLASFVSKQLPRLANGVLNTGKEIVEENVQEVSQGLIGNVIEDFGNKSVGEIVGDSIKEIPETLEQTTISTGLTMGGNAISSSISNSRNKVKNQSKGAGADTLNALYENQEQYQKRSGAIEDMSNQEFAKYLQDNNITDAADIAEAFLKYDADYSYKVRAAQLAEQYMQEAGLGKGEDGLYKNEGLHEEQVELNNKEAELAQAQTELSSASADLEIADQTLQENLAEFEAAVMPDEKLNNLITQSKANRDSAAERVAENQRRVQEAEQERDRLKTKLSQDVGQIVGEAQSKAAADLQEEQLDYSGLVTRLEQAKQEELERLRKFHSKTEQSILEAGYNTPLTNARGEILQDEDGTRKVDPWYISEAYSTFQRIDKATFDAFVENTAQAQSAVGDVIRKTWLDYRVEFTNTDKVNVDHEAKTITLPMGGVLTDIIRDMTVEEIAMMSQQDKGTYERFMSVLTTAEFGNDKASADAALDKIKAETGLDADAAMNALAKDLIGKYILGDNENRKKLAGLFEENDEFFLTDIPNWINMRNAKLKKAMGDNAVEEAQNGINLQLFSWSDWDDDPFAEDDSETQEEYEARIREAEEDEARRAQEKAAKDAYRDAVLNIDSSENTTPAGEEAPALDQQRGFKTKFNKLLGSYYSKVTTNKSETRTGADSIFRQMMQEGISRVYDADGTVIGTHMSSDLDKALTKFAYDVVDSQVSETDAADTYRSIYNTFFKNGRYFISKEDASNFADFWDYINNSTFSHKITTVDRKAQSIDSLYSELSESYPELFPSDVLNVADKLEQIDDAMDELKSKRYFTAQDELGEGYEDAVKDTKAEIIDDYFKLVEDVTGSVPVSVSETVNNIKEGEAIDEALAEELPDVYIDEDGDISIAEDVNLEELSPEAQDVVNEVAEEYYNTGDEDVVNLYNSAAHQGEDAIDAIAEQADSEEAAERAAIRSDIEQQFAALMAEQPAQNPSDSKALKASEKWWKRFRELTEQLQNNTPEGFNKFAYTNELLDYTSNVRDSWYNNTDEVQSEESSEIASSEQPVVVAEEPVVQSEQSVQVNDVASVEQAENVQSEAVEDWTNAIEESSETFIPDAISSREDAEFKQLRKMFDFGQFNLDKKSYAKLAGRIFTQLAGRRYKTGKKILTNPKNALRRMALEMGTHIYENTKFKSEADPFIQDLYKTRSNQIMADIDDENGFAAAMYGMAKTVEKKLASIDVKFDTGIDGYTFDEFFYDYMTLSTKELYKRGLLEVADRFTNLLERQKLNWDGPEIAQTIAMGRNRLRAWMYVMTAEQRMRAYIRPVGEKQKDPGVEGLLGRFRQNVIDSGAGAKVIDRLANEYKKSVTGSNAKNYAMQLAVYRRPYQNSAYETWYDGACVDLDGQVTGAKSLHSIMEAYGITSDEDIADFKLLLTTWSFLDRVKLEKTPTANEQIKLSDNKAAGVALYSIDDEALAEMESGMEEGLQAYLNIGITPASAQSILDSFLDSNNKNYRGSKFADAAKEFYKTWDSFIQTYLVDTGIWDASVYARFKKDHPHYVPFNRQEGGFKLAEAKGGSNEQVIDPFDNALLHMRDIVTKASKNRVAQVFDDIYRTTPNLGYMASITTEEDILNGQKEPKGDNVIVVYRNGQNNRVRTWYTFSDPGILSMLKECDGTFAARNVREALRGIRKVTRQMSMFMTTLNPLFGIGRNPIKDMFSAINHGSFATNPITGIIKWANTFVDVTKETAKGTGSQVIKDYKNMGGFGYTRAGEAVKVLNEYRGDIFGRNEPKYKKICMAPFRAVASLADIMETTTRATEYKFGKAATGTAQGQGGRAAQIINAFTNQLTFNSKNQQGEVTQESRDKAFMESREVTVDFLRGGNGMAVQILKAAIPFLNAKIQGLDRTIRELTAEEQRSRLAPRLIKSFINNAIYGIGTVFLCMGGFKGDDRDDEEKAMAQWYLDLQDDLKRSHVIFPWFTNGEREFFRFPISEDWIDRVFFEFFRKKTEEMLTGKYNMNDYNYRDTFTDMLETFYGATMEELDLLSVTSIASPLIALFSNKNYWGGQVVSDAIGKRSLENQFKDTTPVIYKWAASAIANTLGVIPGIRDHWLVERWSSPLFQQYFWEQYTGIVGSLVGALLSPNPATGKLDWKYSAYGLKNMVRNRFTLDAQSNDIDEAYNDMKKVLENINADMLAGVGIGKADPTLSPEKLEEMSKFIYDEFVKSSGYIPKLDKEISSLWSVYYKLRAIPTGKLNDDNAAILSMYGYNYGAGHNLTTDELTEIIETVVQEPITALKKEALEWYNTSFAKEYLGVDNTVGFLAFKASAESMPEPEQDYSIVEDEAPALPTGIASTPVSTNNVFGDTEPTGEGNTNTLPQETPSENNSVAGRFDTQNANTRTVQVPAGTMRSQSQNVPQQNSAPAPSASPTSQVSTDNIPPINAGTGASENNTGGGIIRGVRGKTMYAQAYDGKQLTDRSHVGKWNTSADGRAYFVTGQRKVLYADEISNALKDRFRGKQTSAPAAPRQLTQNDYQYREKMSKAFYADYDNGEYYTTVVQKLAEGNRKSNGSIDANLVPHARQSFNHKGVTYNIMSYGQAAWDAWEKKYYDLYSASAKKTFTEEWWNRYEQADAATKAKMAKEAEKVETDVRDATKKWFLNEYLSKQVNK